MEEVARSARHRPETIAEIARFVTCEVVVVTHDAAPVDLRRLSRILLWTAVVVGVVSLVATAGWSLWTAGVRLLDGVEGEVLFEADRLRRGLPLYVDPAVGALEDGPPPARYLVLYPPLWPAVVALAPKGAAAVVGRLTATLGWFGLLAWVVARAPRARRRACGLLALYAAGSWLLAFFATSARPDAIAVVAAGLALERTARRAGGAGPGLDVTSGVLLALAVWLKPNVVGMAPGVVLGAFFASRRDRGLRAALRAVTPGVLAGSAVTLVIALRLGALSQGTWLAHLLRSTGQPPSFALWWDQITQRGPFFLPPIAVALYAGLRRPNDPGARVATAALVTSTGWCLLCLSKIGSASNYWLEPMVAATVVIARVDLPSPDRASPPQRFAFAAWLLLQACWSGVASVRTSVERLSRDAEQRAFIDDARTLCRAGDGLVLADEPGLEWMLDGRIVQTPFQSTHAARRGRFSEDAWVADVEHPAVRCLIMQDDLLERPVSEIDVDHDRFGPKLRRAMTGRFRRIASRAGLYLYADRAITSDP